MATAALESQDVIRLILQFCRENGLQRSLQCLQEDPKHRPDSAKELKIRLLAIPQGAHINAEQKLRAEQGFTSFKSKFLLLDVLREDRFGGVYLYQQK